MSKIDLDEGERIGALMSAEDDVVESLGRGEYIGNKVPSEKASGLFAEIFRAMERTIPAFKLDDGGIVYACECWWTFEEDFKEKIRNYRERGWKIKKVSIEEKRENIKDDEEKDKDKDYNLAHDGEDVSPTPGVHDV